MPRPIIITEEMKQQALVDFSEMLDSTKMSDGKLNFSQNFTYPASNATVWLTMDAYRKIVALVTTFSNEVAWHGTVSRIGSNEFVIEDVFVYPQEVTASTVNTDQEAYTQWLYELDDATFNNIRMQGHSHNNMGVSPSGVDNNHRQQILDQLEPEMYYVFMIWNKSLSIHALVYDMQHNVLYENNDVEVKLLGDDMVDLFLADAKTKIKKVGHKKGKHLLKNKGVKQLEFEEEYPGFGTYRQYGIYEPYGKYGGYL